jgi:hypothetical protein
MAELPDLEQYEADDVTQEEYSQEEYDNETYGKLQADLLEHD